MNHIMLLRSTLRIIVGSAVEDEVTRLHLLEGQISWQCIELVGLVPAIQLEPKVLPQVVHDLAHKCAAIQENWRVI